VLQLPASGCRYAACAVGGATGVAAGVEGKGCGVTGVGAGGLITGVAGVLSGGGVGVVPLFFPRTLVLALICLASFHARSRSVLPFNCLTTSPFRIRTHSGGDDLVARAFRDGVELEPSVVPRGDGRLNRATAA